MQTFNRKTLGVLVGSCLVLGGCNNDMKQSKPVSVVKSSYTSSAVVLSGKVEGLAERVELFDVAEHNIASAQVQEKGRYQIDVPEHTKLPFLLRSGEFMTVVIDTDMTSYDINALTTRIAQRAKSLGGYTRQNMVLAAGDSVNVPDANKTTTGFRGDPTSQYGGWH